MRKLSSVLLVLASILFLIGCIEIDDIESIEFSEYPKTTYVINETLEYFTVDITTSEGTETLNSYDSRLIISGFDTTTAGTKTMTITVEGLENASINFVYTVVSSLSDLLFAGGTGTSIDPYEIETPQHLSNIRFALDKHFVLVDDIDLAGIEWIPIGEVVTESCGDRCMSIVVDESTFFTGTLSGDIEGSDENHAIMNLTTEYTENFGLFIGINDGFVTDLDLVDVDITGHRVGALAFTILGNTTIEDISISGHLSTSFSAGGLSNMVSGDIRENVITTIRNVTNNADITGTNLTAGAAMIGGLIGQTTLMGENGDWNDSDNDLTHDSGEHTALVQKNKLVIDDSHNTGDITHIYNTTVGTIAGQLIGQATQGGWQYSGLIEIIDSTGTGTIIGNSGTTDSWKWSFYGFQNLSSSSVSSDPDEHYNNATNDGRLVGRNNLSTKSNLTFTNSQN